MSFIGVTIHHGRPHLTRSILEGGAFQIRAALEDLREAGATRNEIRLIGGGAASPLWAQIVTDVLDLPLVVPRYRSAAYGTGILAGVGAGLFPSERPHLEPMPYVPVEHELRPGPDVDIYETSYRSYLKVEEQLAAIDSPSH